MSIFLVIIPVIFFAKVAILKSMRQLMTYDPHNCCIVKIDQATSELDNLLIWVVARQKLRVVGNPSHANFDSMLAALHSEKQGKFLSGHAFIPFDFYRAVKREK